MRSRLLARTFVVEDALHLHGGPGVGDAEHGAGHQALQGWGAVRGSDQTPVGPLVAALQDLHRLAAADRQLVAVAGHEVVNHHGEFAATRQLRRRRGGGGGSAEFFHCVQWIRHHLRVSVCVCVCLRTLSLSSVFCEVRDAREMVSGWLLPSP